MKKVLIVCTNTASYPESESKTGLWIGEVTHFLNELEQQGIGYQLTSPMGGKIPLDPASFETYDKLNLKYIKTPEFAQSLKNSPALENIKIEDFAAIYFAGGHGAMFDFPESEGVQKAAKHIYRSGGIVSAICHGSSALINVLDDRGENIIAGKSITGFSNLEELIIRKTKLMPFKLQDEISAKGATFVKALLPFLSRVVVSENIITGQNPASAKNLGKAVATAVGALMAEPPPPPPSGPPSGPPSSPPSAPPKFEIAKEGSL